MVVVLCFVVLFCFWQEVGVYLQVPEAKKTLRDPDVGVHNREPSTGGDGEANARESGVQRLSWSEADLIYTASSRTAGAARGDLGLISNKQKTLKKGAGVGEAGIKNDLERQ